MINYYLLMKPGIIMGNLVTFAAGFLLASRGELKIALFMEALLGLSLIIASACIFNNYIDRDLDKKMKRTEERALATGKIKPLYAIFLAVTLGIAGNLMLFIWTNVLTVMIANIGFGVYVLLYSFLKSKTTYSTLIGSISGAVPPVVGYCAVSNQFDMAAAMLFLILIFWQMPHFFAIALWHFDDYENAGIPVMPAAKGTTRTKVHMVLYIVCLIPMVAMLTVMGYTGYMFASVTTIVGLVWLYYCVKGFSAECDVTWGRQMFWLSLVMINAISLLIPLEFMLV